MSAYLSDLVSYRTCHSSLCFSSLAPSCPKPFALAFPSDLKALFPGHCMTGFFSSFGTQCSCYLLREVFPDHPLSCAFIAATVTSLSTNAKDLDLLHKCKRFSTNAKPLQNPSQILPAMSILLLLPHRFTTSFS